MQIICAKRANEYSLITHPRITWQLSRKTPIVAFLDWRQQHHLYGQHLVKVVLTYKSLKLQVSRAVNHRHF